MIKFPQQELHRLSAAEGWLELGNYLEATSELDQMLPEYQESIEVLGLRWSIYSSARLWEQSLDMAVRLIVLCPHEPQPYIHRSYSLHEMKRTREARDSLLEVLPKFPRLSVIYYNLACYEAQLGDLASARRYLKKAFALPGGRQLKRGAATDPDLAPLSEDFGNVD